MDQFWTWLLVVVGGGSVLFTVALIVVVSLCTLVPFAVIGWLIYNQFKKRNAVIASAAAWQTTTGRVLHSSVAMQHTHDGQHSLQPAIVYAFDVGGRTYQGTQIRAGDSVMRVNVSGDAAMIVNRYPVGAIVQIYYNPLNPNEAALER